MTTFIVVLGLLAIVAIIAFWIGRQPTEVASAGQKIAGAASALWAKVRGR